VIFISNAKLLHVITATKKTLISPYGLLKVDTVEHSIMLKQESSGTQTAYLMLSRLLPVFTYGGEAVIDELEADLDPEMLVPILDLFFPPETNPHNPQIIFTCHSNEVLSLLNKAQVVLVEKMEPLRIIRGDWMK